MNIEPAELGEATYCPEDNKLRMYVGRVPRAEYDALRAEGWTATPKQDCDFVATWTAAREDTALTYGGGVIGDEDQSPQDRAADRAERFAGYREKRAGEAIGHADAFDDGPTVHGYQSAALAERRAARHDLCGTRAVNQWAKAEYWQRRTAGVISHALHVSAPGVRMGRIKEIEADQRKHEAARAEHRRFWEGWQRVSTMDGADALLPLDDGGYADTEKLNPAQRLAYGLANSGSYHASLLHPDGGAINENGRRVQGVCFYGFSAYDFLTHDTYGGGPFRRLTPREYALHYLSLTKHPDEYGRRYSEHLALRLAYENQMIEAQGGRAAFVEMEAGGWLGEKQIQKVNKSPSTGRVVSVQVWGSRRGYTRESNYHTEETRPCLLTIDTERLAADVYRAPTDEERAAFADAKKAAKKARGVVSTINPTDEDAERLQAQMNAEAAETDKGQNYPRKPGEVEHTTQAKYSNGWKESRVIRDIGKVKVRLCSYGWQHVESVVVLDDKPQKPLPASVWKDAQKPIAGPLV